jgi:hypothetical protein
MPGKDFSDKARYMAMSFSIAFLVFSIIILIMMSFFHPNNAAASREVVVNDIEQAWAPDADDALTVLFMGVSAREAVPGVFILARFDPANACVPLTALPPQTAIANNGVMEPIGDIYRYGGASYTKTALEKALGVPVDRYVRVDTAAFIAAANIIGTVEFELHDDVIIVEGGASVTLNKGMQLFDGSKVAALVQAPYAQEEEKCLMAARISAEIVNQRMDIALSAAMDQIFEKTINLVDTDISNTDYTSRKEAAAYLAENSTAPAVVIGLSGQWDESGRLYTLTDTFLAQIANKMN